ncbi:MAG TPA: glycosyltransferase family 39 protein [Polyangiaceae bacterium]
MASPTRLFPAMAIRIGVWTIVTALVAFYLGQNWRLAPNNTDDGLILDYIHQMSLGAMPHYDMIDAYGLFNWVFPVSFYQLAGQKVWGVRLWIVVLKLISVALAYRTVTRLTNRFYGILGALGLMVLLGQAWQSLQTAYAFLTVVPLVLAAWHVLLSQPFRRQWANPLVAGVFTTLTIWTKLNTGLYLFAAGLFVLLCWLPWGESNDAAASPRVEKLRPLMKPIRIAGAVAYGIIFYAYVRAHFNFLYFVYLLGPLMLGLGWAVYTALKEPAAATPIRRHLQAWLIYFGSTVGLSLFILFGYYGVSGAEQYAREVAGILSSIHYHYPFPVIGRELLYVGFNENYWPQLNWLFTALFIVWLVLQRRFGERSFGSEWPKRRAQAGAIFLLGTLHSFSLYARSDETHIYQALLLVVPALFVFVFQLERFMREWRASAVAPFRQGLAMVLAIYASTITVRPSMEPLRLWGGDYTNPRLQWMVYRPFINLYVRNFSMSIPDRDWDSLVDLAARYIDDSAYENEPILVQSAERFVHYASRTTSVGGRHAFHFYLISVRLLDRAGFDKVVPRQVILDIMNDPPRFIVTSGDTEPTVPDFPEFKLLRRDHYDQVKKFRHLHIYKIRPGAREAIAQNPYK